MSDMGEKIAEILCTNHCKAVAEVPCKSGHWDSPSWVEQSAYPNLKQKWLDEADKILSQTVNGYSIKEMIDLFEKIDRGTQREAVVRKDMWTVKLPEIPAKPKNISLEAFGQRVQQDMLNAGFRQVEEEKDRP